MKKIYILSICIAGILTACNDEFMERYPQTDITAAGYFKNEADLQTYVNGFYDMSLLYPRNTVDNEQFSDNMGHRDSQVAEMNILTGNYSKEVATGWGSWDVLRSINFMLVNSDKATGNTTDIQHYIGIARYFRAVFYIDKLQNYSDVPWYNKPLATNDEEMYKAADPRTLIADSIIADLEFAAANIKPDLNNRTTINKYAALTLLARFSLFEGTFRKYHPELNLQTTAETFLNKAVTAAQQIINSNVFSITGSGRAGYTALFTSESLASNAEIILMTEYVNGLGEGNSSYAPLSNDNPYDLSRSLMETYLMADGSRFTEQPGYDKKEFKDVFVDRDPRIYETFCTPGFTRPIDSSPWRIIVRNGGYQCVKFYPRTTGTLGGNTWRACWNDLPVYRYAEVLLTLAEAKAELGTLTQSDLDNTVNKIRARVSMPALSLTAANSSPDPWLKEQYPNVSGANAGVILEIRRERRVELALEGQRLMDIHRWYVGELLTRDGQGIYIPKLGAYDTNGDGLPDIAFVNDANDLSPLADIPESQMGGIQIQAINAQSVFYLSEGDHGYLMFNSDRLNARSWVSPKYYYRPIPASVQTLKPNLQQVFGW